MLRYIILVSFCWAVFYLIYHVWLRRETFFAINRWYLLGSLLVGLCIPLLELPDFQGPADAPLSFVYQAPVVIGGEWLEVTVRPEAEMRTGPTVWQVLSWIYLTGVVLATLRFFYGLLQIYQLYRGAEIIDRPGYKLVRTNRPHLPFSFFNLLFQSRRMTLQEVEEQQIHHHEQAHITGWHSIDVVLVELVAIALWCSPFVYLYRRSLRDVHEYLADAAVLKNTRRKQYSKLLLRQFQSGLQLALANHFIRSQFKNRINMMTRKRSRSGALLKYLLVLPALAIAVFLFAKRTALAEDLNWNGQSAEELLATGLDTIPKTAEVMPRYPGCEELETEAERDACAQKQFLMYIYKNIHYPKEARQASIQGTVVVNFTIDETGKMRDPQILKTPGGGLGEVVLDLLREMPEWKPGRNGSQAVAVQMTLPVKFGLEGELEKEDPPADQYDTMPVYAGCEDLTDPAEIKKCTAEKLGQFLTNQIKYPAEAREMGIEGRVYVQLTIDETGKVAGAEIARSLDDQIDAEALRVVQLLPDWQPAMKDGIAVATKLTIPIHFDLPLKHDAVVIGYKMPEAHDRAPRFPGCESEAGEKTRTDCAQKAFLAYVFNNIRYPKAAKDGKVEGTVIASFEVDEKGKIENVKILRSLGYGADEEVERVLLSMNDLPTPWVPARKDGEAVRASMTLPVKFALPKEKEKRNLASLQVERFRLSPNPNNGQFQLSFQAEPMPTFIQITDAAGKVVFEEKLANFSGEYRGQLNLNQKTSGTYFLAILQEGKGKFTHTFIVR